MVERVEIAQAIFDFETDQPGELPLLQGQLVQVLNMVNKEWYEGYSGGIQGMFPAEFVHLFPEYYIPIGGRLFVCEEEFPELQSGDLAIQPGDIVVGLESLNVDWWKGHLNGTVGDFPLTHVQQIDLVSSKSDSTLQGINDELHAQNSLNSHTNNAYESDTYLPATTTPAVNLQATALYDFKPESSTELRLYAGDIISFITCVDSEWLQGTLDGKTGMFPAAFVEYIDNLSTYQEAEALASATVMYDFQAELPDEVSLVQGQVVSIVCKSTDDWTRVETDYGATGLCPTSFLSLGPEGDIPPSLTTTSQPQTSHFDTLSHHISTSSTSSKDNASLQPVQNKQLTKPPKPPSPAKPASIAQPPTLAPTAAPGKPAKPTRPPLSKQLSDKLSSQSQPPEDDVYSALKEPFESQFKWKDENPPVKLQPSVTRPPPPKKSVGSLASPKSSVSTSTETPAQSNITPASSAELKSSSPAQTNANTSLTSTSVPRNRPPPPKKKPTESMSSAKSPNSQTETNTEIISSTAPGESDVLAKVLSEPSEPGQDIPSVTTALPMPLPSRPKSAVISPTRPSPPIPAVVSPTRPNPPVAAVVSPTRPKLPVAAAVSPTQPTPPVSKQAQQPSSPNLDTTIANTHQLPEAVKATLWTPVPTRSVPPIPTRVAPPPPKSSTRAQPSLIPTRPAPKRPGTPNNKQEVEFDEKAVQLLQNKIATLEAEIQKYNDEVEDLDGLIEGNNIDDKLQFYIENINGMTEEVHILKEQLSEAMSRSSATTNAQSTQRQQIPDEKTLADLKLKRQDKRSKVIQELLSTEQAHLKDLKLCMKVFVEDSNLQPPASVDLDTLFSNMPEVIEASQTFVSLLEAEANKDFDHQVIGSAFLTTVELMKSAYAHYCRNHDDVCALLEEYQDDCEIQSYFSEGLDEMKKHTTVFTIGAFLIKPVQRILKYPLLLRELTEATEDSHIDKPELQKAQLAQIDLAQHINEYKRRKDLVYKYRQDKDDRLADKMSRLTLHSIKKKSNRISMKLTSSMGLSEQTVDKEFEKEEQYFRGLERSVRAFTKNLSTFLQQMQAMLDVKETVATDLADYYFTNTPPEVQQYFDAQQSMTTKVFRKFKRDMEENALANCTKLMSLFHSPTKIIEKRHDKLLDYDSCQSKLEKTKEIDRLKVVREELQAAKNDYEALNSQLKDELPKFNSLVYDIFKDCIVDFAQKYLQYQRDSLHLLYPLLQLPALSAAGEFMKVFDQEHARMSEMINDNPLISGILSDRKPSGKPGDASAKPSISSAPQSSGQKESAKAQLKQTYAADKLYILTADYTAMDRMDLSASKGDLVGVIMDKDPMGNKNRWYIDNGVAKGFIQCGCLTAYETAPPSYHTVVSNTGAQSQLSAPSDNQSRSRRSSTADSPHTKGQIQPIRESTGATAQRHNSGTPQYEEYRALFDFKARNSNEISITTGQTVYVFSKHDEDGNEAWWYIQTNHGFGYTPANYLTPLR